jgi:hypothetical protein
MFQFESLRPGAGFNTGSQLSTGTALGPTKDDQVRLLDLVAAEVRARITGSPAPVVEAPGRARSGLGREAGSWCQLQGGKVHIIRGVRCPVLGGQLRLEGGQVPMIGGASAQNRGFKCPL